ncbi:MAG: NAD(P)H-binding protein [Thermoplasmata archaeon]|nr:NAD(P)H-binding protein [Thermoplasmata archaeon]
MKVILTGATGMVGQGVLRECLLDPQVESVVSLGRSATGKSDPKLRELVRSDLTDLDPVEDQLRGFDACFFCLGIPSAGMSEADYTRVTYDLTIAVAQKLVNLNSAMTFIYVSGAGTDSSEHGRSMWARVKGRTENALLRMPFRAAYMFRPGVIRARHGIRSRSTTYRVLYAVLLPVVLLAAAVAPSAITSTEQVGRAMIHAAGRGAPKPLLGTRDINELAR